MTAPLRHVAVLAATVLSSCSTQQAYGGAQAWQRNECSKIVDAQERNRCTASTRTSYEEYKREAEAAKTSK